MNNIKLEAGPQNMETAIVSRFLKQEKQWLPIIKEASEEYKLNGYGSGNIFGRVAIKHIEKFDTGLWFDLLAWVLAYKVNWEQVLASLESAAEELK